MLLTQRLNGAMGISSQHPRPLFLEHILAINEFRINLGIALQQEGHRLDMWLDDTALKKMAAKGRLAEPDGFGFFLNIPPGYCEMTLESD